MYIFLACIRVSHDNLGAKDWNRNQVELDPIHTQIVIYPIDYGIRKI